MDMVIFNSSNWTTDIYPVNCSLMLKLSIVYQCMAVQKELEGIKMFSATINQEALFYIYAITL